MEGRGTLLRGLVVGADEDSVWSKIPRRQEEREICEWENGAWAAREWLMDRLGPRSSASSCGCSKRGP